MRSIPSGALRELAMTAATIHSSRPDQWTAPRQSLDPSLRRMKYGPLRPMDEDRGFFGRLFGR
jgi:hypothetical protein